MSCGSSRGQKEAKVKVRVSRLVYGGRQVVFISLLELRLRENEVS
jgi:hypothetical protein